MRNFGRNFASSFFFVRIVEIFDFILISLHDLWYNLRNFSRMMKKCDIWGWGFLYNSSGKKIISLNFINFFRLFKKKKTELYHPTNILIQNNDYQFLLYFLEFQLCLKTFNLEILSDIIKKFNLISWLL